MKAMVPLYSVQGYFLRKLPRREAQELIREGSAALRRDGSGRIVGCKMLRLDRAPSGGPQMLTAADMQRNAGLRGASRTERMSERAKRERERRGLAAEDAIERSQIKVKMWFAIPLTNPTHAAWGAGA